MAEAVKLTPLQWAGQVCTYAVLAVAVGYLADSPALELLPGQSTTLRLVVRASGLPVGECRARDAAELSELAPNMRQPVMCARGKRPMMVEVDVNGAAIFAADIKASGLHDDGVLALFREFPLDAGETRLRVRVWQDAATTSPSHGFDQQLTVSPHHIVIVEFTDAGLQVRQPGAAPS